MDYRERPADRDVVQRALADLYERVGPRVVLVCIGGALGIAAVTGVAAAALGARYLAVPTSDALIACAKGMALMAVGVFASLYFSRDIIRTSLDWSPADATPERAAEAWDAITRGARVVMWRCVVGACIAAIPVAVAAPAALDLPGYAALVIAAGIATAMPGAWVLITFGTELVVRPMVEDIAAYLPQDFGPSDRSWRLQTKALAPLPVVAAFGALTTGAFADLAAPGPPRLAVALGIAVAAGSIAGVIFLIVTRSLLDPMDDLLAATRRVRQGDLDTGVPVVTSDDLGQLAHSFNQMLAGLREREALRRHNVELVEDLHRHAAELRDSRARIVAAADAERRRVERDLHDGAQQHLVLLALKLGLFERMIEDRPEAMASVAELRRDLDRALVELRDLAHGIYPASLENEGLAGALRQAVDRAGMPATLECGGAGRYRRELEAAVYFCCLEALQNAAKHAGDGARATVRLAERDGALAFEVVDDGRGFDPERVGASAGLHNMTDRIGALGGELIIESARGGGTRVVGVVPLAAPRA